MVAITFSSHDFSATFLQNFDRRLALHSLLAKKSAALVFCSIAGLPPESLTRRPVTHTARRQATARLGSDFYSQFGAGSTWQATRGSPALLLPIQQAGSRGVLDPGSTIRKPALLVAGGDARILRREERRKKPHYPINPPDHKPG